MNKPTNIQQAINQLHSAMEEIGLTHIAIAVAFQIGEDADGMDVMRSSKTHDSDLAYLVVGLNKLFATTEIRDVED